MKCWDFVIVRNLPRKNQSPGITGCSQLMKTVFAAVTELILPGWLVATPILDHDNDNLYQIHTPLFGNYTVDMTPPNENQTPPNIQIIVIQSDRRSNLQWIETCPKLNC